jgi:hypothetical protein
MQRRVGVASRKDVVSFEYRIRHNRVSRVCAKFHSVHSSTRPTEPLHGPYQSDKDSLQEAPVQAHLDADLYPKNHSLAIHYQSPSPDPPHETSTMPSSQGKTMPPPTPPNTLDETASCPESSIEPNPAAPS